MVHCTLIPTGNGYIKLLNDIKHSTHLTPSVLMTHQPNNLLNITWFHNFNQWRRNLLIKWGQIKLLKTIKLINWDSDFIWWGWGWGVGSKQPFKNTIQKTPHSSPSSPFQEPYSFLSPPHTCQVYKSFFPLQRTISSLKPFPIFPIATDEQQILKKYLCH